MDAARDDVEFTSHGATLRGWLYPADTTPGPGIVMAHGLTAVKEMFLDRYAAKFAAAGFTTLVYDHYGFGGSDGEPRQFPAPSLQLEGYRDAITWLGAHPSVDPSRIGIWGSSFSGGEVIILAAEDLPIQAAVAQVPALGDEGPELSAATLTAITDAFAEGRSDATVPAVTATPDGFGIMFGDDAHGWFTRTSASMAPSWRDEIRVSAFAEPFRPIDHLADAKVPLLLLVAPDDMLTPPGQAIAVAGSIPEVELVEMPGGHFDAYEHGFAQTSTLATEWFRSHLLR